MRAFAARLRDAFRRRAIARDFDAERDHHLAELEQIHIERGASPAEAREAALRDFGGALGAAERVRDQAGFPTWDELTSDLRHAARGLARRPCFAGSVIVILGLGLGAAATIHGLIDAVFLRPLPVPHPEQLYAVVSGTPGVPTRLSRGTARRLEASLPAGSVMAYGSGARCTIQVGANAGAEANVRLVNGSFFGALGVVPGFGRLIGQSDDVTGAPTSVVVASFAWASKNFGAAESAVGRQVVFNRVPMTVVGVLPEGFREIAVGQRTDFWLAAAAQRLLGVYGSASMSEGDDRPNDPDWNREERVSWLQFLVRVRPGESVPAAALQRAWEPERDELIRSDDDVQDQAQIRHRSWVLSSAPQGISRFRDHFHSTGWLLGGVVGVLLILVCTNVSGFLLVRSMSRHRELGVRLALGAGPLRIVRLGFFEAGLLSAAGGAAGWLLALWLLPMAVRLLAPGRDLDIGLGARSVVLMAVLAAFCAALSALAPGLWISRVQPLNALAGNRGLGRAPVRLGRVLIVAQFALAVALVAVATSLGDELERSLTADPGFERGHVETALFDAESAGYRPAEIPALMARLRDTTLGLPQVKAVGFASCGILAGSESNSGIYMRDPQARLRQWKCQHDEVSGGYFGVVGIPLVRGREFTEADTAASMPVAVVSASFARQVFGDRDPIGQVFGFGFKPSKGDWTVVGVVADVRLNGVREAPPPMFYLAAAQETGSQPQFLAIRFAGPAGSLQENVKAALARSDPGLVLESWMTLGARMADDLSGDMATMRLAAIFGGCSVLLAGIGITGSLGYLVILRQRELGLRLAVGASPGRLLRSVLVDSLFLGSLGSALGIAAVWLLPLVPSVKAALDVRPGLGSALVAALITLTTAALAGYIPARRASRIDPISMLKAE